MRASRFGLIITATLSLPCQAATVRLTGEEICSIVFGGTYGGGSDNAKACMAAALGHGSQADNAIFRAAIDGWTGVPAIPKCQYPAPDQTDAKTCAAAAEAYDSAHAANIEYIDRLNGKSKAINSGVTTPPPAIKAQKPRDDEEPPMKVINDTYYDYAFIKKCQMRRDGYVIVYVSDAEVDEARTLASKIEDTTKKRMLNTAHLQHAWDVAQDSVLSLTRFYNGYSQIDRDLCQKHLSALRARAGRVAPGAVKIQKDF